MTENWVDKYENALLYIFLIKINLQTSHKEKNAEKEEPEYLQEYVDFWAPDWNLDMFWNSSGHISISPTPLLGGI